MEIGWGKTTFSARYYFYARADSMQKCSYRGARGRLRLIKLERIDSRCHHVVLRATSDGVVSSMCCLKMYFSRSTLLTMPWWFLSSLIRWAWMDSAPCSPIMPAPILHIFSHGMTCSSKMCIPYSRKIWRGIKIWRFGFVLVSLPCSASLLEILLTTPICNHGRTESSLSYSPRG